MTDWHPALTDADPADAWYPPDKLERQRQAEEKERAFRHLVERRRIFQKAVAAAVDPPQRIALASGTKQTRRPVMPLTYRTLKDAEGKPIYPDRLYTPLSSYGRAVDDAPIVFNSELTQLRGDHEAVMAAPALWVAVDTSTDEKAALRRARSAARLADVRPPRDDRFDPPRRIPQARRMIAIETFWAGPHFVKKGAERDIDDPAVRRAPEYFRPALEPDEAA